MNAQQLINAAFLQMVVSFNSWLITESYDIGCPTWADGEAEQWLKLIAEGNFILDIGINTDSRKAYPVLN